MKFFNILKIILKNFRLIYNKNLIYIVGLVGIIYFLFKILIILQNLHTCPMRVIIFKNHSFLQKNKI